jgi:hypothetical protein
MISNSSEAPTRHSSVAPSTRDSLASNITRYSGLSILDGTRMSKPAQTPHDSTRPSAPVRQSQEAENQSRASSQKDLPPVPIERDADNRVRYRCTCGIPCARRSDLLKHAKNKHTYSAGYTCKICSHVEPSVFDIEAHIGTHGAQRSSKPLYQERRLVREDFFLGCRHHGKYFENLQQFVDHLTEDSEVRFIRAYLLDPSVEGQLGKLLPIGGAALDNRSIVERLCWTAEDARAIIRRNSDERGHVDLSTSVKMIVEKALEHRPLDLGPEPAPRATRQSPTAPIGSRGHSRNNSHAQGVRTQHTIPSPASGSARKSKATASHLRLEHHPTPGISNTASWPDATPGAANSLGYTPGAAHLGPGSPMHIEPLAGEHTGWEDFQNDHGIQAWESWLDFDATVEPLNVRSASR